MGKESDGILGLPIRFAHETLGLSPNQLSVIGLLSGLVAAGLVVAGHLEAGLAALAFSQIIDGLDGGVARRYGLQSPSGERLEVIFDRACELAFFLALAYVGLASFRMAFLAFTAILLITWIEPRSKFDPGFKRFMMYFGYAAMVLFQVRGFEIALHVVFFANLLGFVIGTILVDYRFQQEVDRQAIERRARETAAGIPQGPDDPPSFLSKLFS
jgi:phosphatidylglycerophosphate synthase